MSGIEYRRLSFHHSQAQRAATYLSRRYANAEALRLGIQAVIDDLAFVKDRAEEFEEAFMQLGVHLGLSAERPEKTRDEGPDVLWGLSATDFWVVEAKNGSNTQHIHKLDANQLAGSMNWFRERYGELAKGTPVMVHKSRQLHDDASATEGMMVLDERGLARLTGAAITLAAGLASGRWDDAATVASQLEGNKLRAGDLASYLRDVIPAR